jgi:hypothetical protein
MNKRDQTNNDNTIIKVGLDGGGSFFKMTLSTIDPERHLNEERKRATYADVSRVLRPLITS